MWRVVYIASNRPTAEAIKGLLTGEGFLVAVRPAGTTDSTGNVLYEVLVPQSEAEEASEAISHLLLSGSGRGEDSRGEPG